MTRQIAALYVQRDGAYYGLDGVDPWDERRDARLYAGPWPVVAHPPCARWSMLAGLVQARWGHAKGDDGGTFRAALDAVRAHGGVLEHPAESAAWSAHGLIRPIRGGWSAAGDGVGWTCTVDQSQYGHRARKSTWLYAVGADLPSLRWGRMSGTAWVSNCANNARGKTVERMAKAERLRTPPAFRDLLISIARSVPEAKP